MEVENKIRILKHAGEWDSVTTDHVSPMALLATRHSPLPPQNHDQLVKSIFNQVKQLFDSHQPYSNYISTPNGKHPRQHLYDSTSSHNRNRFHKDWKFHLPQTPNQTLWYNNSKFVWCTKCNKGGGQWVTSHETYTHVDGYRFQRPRPSPAPQPPHGILRHSPLPFSDPKNNTRDQRVTFVENGINIPPPPTAETTPTHVAQLSLADGIASCFDLLEDTPP